MSVVVAVELQPSRCVIAAVQRTAAGAPRIIAASSIPNTEHLADRLRTIRREWHLPQQIRLILWPRLADRGVIALASRPARPVTLPEASVIRDRAKSILNAGFRVASVVLPEQAIALLSTSIGAHTVGIVLERRCGCLVLTSDGVVTAATYLSWPAFAAADDERQIALTRYQFGAQLTPHVRHVLAQGATASATAFACGGLPDLRVQMVPVIEETDREITVLDDGFPGDIDVLGDIADSVSPSPFQVVVAAAATAN